MILSHSLKGCLVMTQTADKMKTASAVRIRQLSMEFQGLDVLKALNLSIEPGEFVVLLGPSGCGKSTLLRLIAGLLRPTSGSIHFAPQAPKIGFVFQDASLVPWRTSLANVTLPLELAGVARKAASAEAQQLLEDVGLKGFEHHYPDALSGGMRMRVSIARALIGCPGILLLDEPFAALDEITRRRLDEHLKQLTLRRGITTLMITHSIEETLRIADRILVLNRDKGQLVEVMERAEGPSVAEDSNLAKALAARLTAMLETAGGC